MVPNFLRVMTCSWRDALPRTKPMIVKYLDEIANVQLKRRQNFADDDIGSDKPTASMRFTRVFNHLNFEYDLPNDVLAEAEALLQAIEGEQLKARQKK